ncbi:acylphosphatase-2 [Athene cunicularia]|uniref:acylphosphatase-2 n=1 Tax=Athene cunicularia TaxID=194338 RepID=UPI000EF68BC7|nr:acylphosphatase-2 [Athene cunicularia]
MKPSCTNAKTCEDVQLKILAGKVMADRQEELQRKLRNVNSLQIKEKLGWGRGEQGVCFRMYTEEEARKLGVVGWVKNTSQGTVTGQVQGPEDKVNAMKSWLSKVGSPSSRIDRTNFSNEKEIPKLDFTGFSTRY